MKKKLIVIMMTLALVISVMPAPVFAGQTPIEDKAVYYTPASDYKSGDCVLTATKMMIRRACIIKGTGDWTKITNSSLRSLATTLGLLRNSFKVDTEGLVYKVECGYFSGNGESARIKEIENLLRVHPEGIVVHGEDAATTGTHGVLVVTVRNGVVYAADSSRNTGLSNKGIQPWNETTMLNIKKVTKYWYISEVNTSGSTSASDPEVSKAAASTLKIKSVKAPSKIKKGKSYTIKGTVKSNKKIRKVTVRILDSEGNVVVKASKKPNAKTFNVKKLDSKIKFGKLKKGTYTYQVIATDTAQTMTLVNKQFTVY
ncbi:MAG: hypothetical protein E7230_02200 [Clostridiales bacterium]|nr:hypothetical protein [Clostridiales bacterium]